MPTTVESIPRVIVGPTTFEVPGDDGKAVTLSKWEVILDSGAKLLTYSPRAFDAINARIDQPTVFLAELNSKNPDMPPKITVVRDMEGTELFNAAGGKAGGRPGGGGRPQAAYRNTAEGAEKERQSIHRSVALQQAVAVFAGHADGSADIIAMAEDFYAWLQDSEDEG
jgi:hypothetical protein